MDVSRADEIKVLVKKRYGQRALEGKGCCDPIYPGEEVAGLPGTVVGVSAGCGNPVALADLKPGETVLDLGSGGGIDCFLAARRVGPGGRVLGIDMTPEMVELARANARKLGVANVEFYLGELERMPFADGAVDVVISNCVICLAADKEAVFREAFRVLRPGGRFHVSDMVLRGELPREVRDDPEAWASCVAGAESQETYVQQLERAGFVGISIVEEPAYDPQDEGLRHVMSARVVARRP